MSAYKEEANIYTDGTIEKAVNHARVSDNASTDCLLSIAISLKRIADVLEDAFGADTREEARREFREVMSQIEMTLRR